MHPFGHVGARCNEWPVEWWTLMEVRLHIFNNNTAMPALYLNIIGNDDDQHTIAHTTSYTTTCVVISRDLRVNYYFKRKITMHIRDIPWGPDIKLCRLTIINFKTMRFLKAPCAGPRSLPFLTLFYYLVV